MADTDRAQVETSLISNTLVPNGFDRAKAAQIASLLTLDNYPLNMDVAAIQRVANSMFQFGVDGKKLSQPYNMLNMIQPEPGMIR